VLAINLGPAIAINFTVPVGIAEKIMKALISGNIEFCQRFYLFKIFVKE